MTNWFIEYTIEAEKDLSKLDRSQQLLVLKAIQKVSTNPLPQSEAGYGKPLGNHLTSRLSGYLKIKLKKAGIRVVYRLIYEDRKMRIVVISVRDDDAVYRMAMKRL